MLVVNSVVFIEQVSYCGQIWSREENEQFKLFMHMALILKSILGQIGGKQVPFSSELTLSFLK